MSISDPANFFFHKNLWCYIIPNNYGVSKNSRYIFQWGFEIESFLFHVRVNFIIRQFIYIPLHFFRIWERWVLKQISYSFENDCILIFIDKISENIYLFFFFQKWHSVCSTVFRYLWMQIECFDVSSDGFLFF